MRYDSHARVTRWLLAMAFALLLTHSARADGPFSGGTSNSNNPLTPVLPQTLGSPQTMPATSPRMTSPDAFSIRPQVTLPAAQDLRLGPGQWQAGASGLLIYPNPQSDGLLPYGPFDAFATQQRSLFVSHYGTRDWQSSLQRHPSVIFDFPQSWYLRSTAVTGSDSNIPVGLDLGEVWKLQDGTNIYLFGEPQHTIWLDGLAPAK